MALAKLGQDDFSAGAFRGVARHLIPPNGVYSAENLLLDDDGSLYKRGGAAALTDGAAGSGLRWIVDLFLAAGQRTLAAADGGFWVMDDADAPPAPPPSGAGGGLVAPFTVRPLGGAGLAFPVPVAVLGGVAYIGGGTIYGGTQRWLDYSTGTVAVTQGSATVTGTGTSWAANVDAGMLFRIGAAGRYYVVQSVESNTSLTLADPFEGSTASGQSYALTRLGTMATPYVSAPVYAAAGDRLWAADGRVLRMSNGRDPNTGALRAHVWDPLDFHEMPLGAEIIGLMPQRDTLLVFTTGGLLAVSNVYYYLTDALGNAQQTLEQVSTDLILWGASGLASWQGAVVAPCIDGVWLIPPGGAPMKVSKSIEGRYLEHVASGRVAGQTAVFRGQLLLPVLDAATGAVVDLLVCRLDRPADDGRGQTVWPWVWLSGHDAECPAFTVKVGGAGAARAPQLLGASLTPEARVLDCSGFFAPTSGNRLESDGSLARWLVETRDFTTGSGNLNTVRRMQVRYELEDGGEAPAIEGYISKGAKVSDGTVWGSFVWGASSWSDASLAEWQQLPGPAPVSSGRDPHTWATLARTRFVRGRLQSSDPAANMVLRSIAFFLRLSLKDR